MSILSLDVSTSITGVCVLEKNDPPIILCLDHIEFKKCKTFWDKVDHVREYFNKAKMKPEFANITKIIIEDPSKKFSQGLSSINTIITLARFNGLVSYLVREIFHLEPEYVSAAHARKLCGLKMQQKKKCGLTHKEQTFQAMMRTDLKHITWPLKKRSTKIVDCAYDIVDAYVIGKAGTLGAGEQL